MKTRKRVTLAIFSHGDVAQRIQSTSLRTRGLEVRILPSSPNFKYGDECKASSGQYFKLDLAGSSPAFPANTFRGRLIGRTAGSEPVNRGSNPFPEAILSGRSTEAIWACFGNKCSQVRILLPGPDWVQCSRFQVQGSRFKVVRKGTLNFEPGTLNLLSRTRGQIGKGAGLRNRILKVRILPRVPIC